jgi:hypothetical protein
MMKTNLFMMLLMCCANALAAAPVFQGDYKCAGYDPYIKKHYTGTVSIREQNTVYKILMQYDTGEKLVATGGQYNEQLMSVVFQDPSNLKKVGLEQYTFADDRKKIQGYWVYLGQDKLGSEVCEKIEAKTGA